MFARPPTAALVMGAAFVSGSVVEAVEAVAGALGTEEPIDARPVAGIDARLSPPALVVSVVAGSAAVTVVCGGTAGRLASLRGSGRGAGVDGAAAIGDELVAGSSGRRSDAWRWIRL